MGSVDSLGGVERIGVHRLPRYLRGRSRAANKADIDMAEFQKRMVMVDDKLAEHPNCACDSVSSYWHRRKQIVRDASQSKGSKLARRVGVGAIAVCAIVSAALAPLIYQVVVDTNRVVSDTNKVVKVYRTPEQEKHDMFIIQDLSRRFDEELLEMRDDPAKFERAVEAAEARLGK